MRSGRVQTNARGCTLLRSRAGTGDARDRSMAYLCPMPNPLLSKDSIVAATETLTSDLDNLGKPDTEAGAKAKESVDQLSTELQGEVSTIEDTLNGASGVAGIIAAVQTISTALGNMGTQVTSTVSDLESLDAKGEFESAFNDASSCSDLAGS